MSSELVEYGPMVTVHSFVLDPDQLLYTGSLYLCRYYSILVQESAHRGKDKCRRSWIVIFIKIHIGSKAP